jgi:hypothetical protein
MLRDALLKILGEWESGLVTEVQVRAMAESLVEGLDETEADEIASDVLVQLEIMNHQLITCAR